MIISNIRATHFKGAPLIEQKFKGVNVITGRNAVGKTRLLELVRVALIGHEPSLGKQKTAKLASGDTMSTLTQFDSGTIIARFWKRTATGGLSEKDAPESVLEIPNVMFDFRNFTNLTGPQQVAHIIAQTDLNALGFSRDALTAEIKSVVPEQPTEETEAATRLILEDVSAANSESDKEKLNLNGWLEKLLTKLKDRLKLAQAEIKRITGAIQTAVQNVDMAETPARSKPDIDRDLEVARAFKSECESQLAVLEDNRQAWQRTTDKRMKLTALIEQPSKLVEIEALRERIKNGIAFIADKTAKAPAYVNTLGEARSSLAVATQNTLNASVGVDDMDCQLQTHGLKNDPCPCCGKTGPECMGWFGEKTKLAKALLDARKKKTECEQLQETAKLHFDNTKFLYDEAVTEDAKLEKAKSTLAQLQRELQNLTDANQQIESAKSELQGLATITATDAGAIQVLQNSVAETKTKIRNLEHELTLSNAEAGKELEREKTRLRQVAKQAEIDVTKLAVDKVTTKQDELVMQSMELIIARARKFTDGIVAGTLAWNGELGIWRGKQWIAHEVFSGTERAVAYIGLSMALSQQSPFKLVIMDELGVVDDSNLETLLKKVCAMQASGEIHQFFGADVRADRYSQIDLPVFNLIEV